MYVYTLRLCKHSTTLNLALGPPLIGMHIVAYPSMDSHAWTQFWPSSCLLVFAAHAEFVLSLLALKALKLLRLVGCHTA